MAQDARVTGQLDLFSPQEMISMEVQQPYSPTPISQEVEKIVPLKSWQAPISQTDTNVNPQTHHAFKPFQL